MNFDFDFGLGLVLAVTRGLLPARADSDAG